MAPTDIVLDDDTINVDASEIDVRSTRGDTENVRTIRLDAQYGDLELGDNGAHGTLSLRNEDGDEQVLLGTGDNSGHLMLGSLNGDQITQTVYISSSGIFEIGGDDENGQLYVDDSAGNGIVSADGDDRSVTVRSRQGAKQIELDGSTATLWVGSSYEGDAEDAGQIRLRKQKDEETIQIHGGISTQYFYQEGEETLALHGQTGTYTAGSPSHDGAVELRSETHGDGGHNTVRLDAEDARLTMAVDDGAGNTTDHVNLRSDGSLTLGGGSVGGDLRLTDYDGIERTQIEGRINGARSGSTMSDTVRIYANSSTGQLVLGGNDTNGEIKLLAPDNQQRAVFSRGTLALGGGTSSNPGQPGSLTLSTTEGIVVGSMSADTATLTVGGAKGEQRDGPTKDSTSTDVEPGESGSIDVEDEMGVGKVTLTSDPYAAMGLRNDDGNFSGAVRAASDALRLELNSGTETITVDGDAGFTGVGPEDPTPVTGAERFGIRSTGSSYGGMYIDSTDTSSGRPFYGYSIDNDVRAYHYWDEGDDELVFSLPSGVVTIASDGTLSAPSKNFVHPVSTDDGEKEVVYTSTESGTPRTEASGLAQVEDGVAEIDLPEHFGLVTSDDEPLLVQVTAHGGERAHPQVTERSTDRVVIEDLGEGADNYELSYTVTGTREGDENTEVVREPTAASKGPNQPLVGDD